MTAAPLHKNHGVKRFGFDATSFLSIYLLLFCAIPSYLTIPALGSIGRLSVLWGAAGVIWWIFYKVQIFRAGQITSSPVKTAVLIFLCALALSYAVANVRGVSSASSLTADSSLIRLASWAGVMLIALDGLNDRGRVNVLLRRVALAGGLMACLGMAQFVSGQAIVDSLTLPGFSVDGFVDNVQSRGDFTRASGTAAHPLEYGAFLCLTLPVAIGLAVADHDRPLWRRSWPPVVISLAVVLSVSRSALIGVAIGLIVLAPSLPAKIRWIGAGVGSVGITAMAFLVPGLIGTVRGLFSSISEDSGTLSRTSSIDEAIRIALHNPIFGQGFGTFLPRELILDNQYLLIFIEGGFVGIFTLLALSITAIISALRATSITADTTWKVMGPAVAAGVAAVSVILAFFDGLSFSITAGSMFLLIGICGAMFRIESMLQQGLLPAPDSHDSTQA